MGANRFMEIELKNWYRMLAPRPVVIVSTVDKKGRVNAAPFSFVMPCSVEPPLIVFASDPGHHTAKNILATKEFVINLCREDMLAKLWECSKAYPAGVSELEKAGFTERKSEKVKAPGIKECYACLECRLNDSFYTGDHIIFAGELVRAYVEDGCFKGGELVLSKANPVMHVGGKNFALAGKIIKVK